MKFSWLLFLISGQCTWGTCEYCLAWGPSRLCPGPLGVDTIWVSAPPCSVKCWHSLPCPSLLWDSSAPFLRWLEWSGLIFLLRDNSAAMGLVMKMAHSCCWHLWVLHLWGSWQGECWSWGFGDHQPIFLHLQAEEEPGWSQAEMLSLCVHLTEVSPFWEDKVAPETRGPMAAFPWPNLSPPAMLPSPCGGLASVETLVLFLKHGSSNGVLKNCGKI